MRPLISGGVSTDGARVIADLFFPLFGLSCRPLPHRFEQCQLVGREFVLAAALAKEGARGR